MIVFIGDHNITKVLFSFVVATCLLLVCLCIFTNYLCYQCIWMCPISLGNYFCLLR